MRKNQSEINTADVPLKRSNDVPLSKVGHFLIIFACQITFCSTLNATILQAPKSVNISENDEIFLYCTVIGDYINWKVNNTAVKDFWAIGFDNSYLPQVVNVSTNERKGKLKIRGNNFINETKVTCHATQLQEELTSGILKLTTAESKPALIRVQGLLDPVTNLTVSFDRNKEISSITWTPPYTLMNVPILSYVVDVGPGLSMNVTNTSTSLEYQTSLIFTNIYVIVRPVNKAGRGKIAATSTEAELHAPSVSITTQLSQSTLPQGDVQCDSYVKIVYPIVIVTFLASYIFLGIITLVLLYRSNKMQKQLKK